MGVERRSKLLLTAAAPRLEGERGAYVGLGSDPGPTRASWGKSPHFPEAKAGGGPNRAPRPRDLRRLARLTLPSLLPGPAQPAAASRGGKVKKPARPPAGPARARHPQGSSPSARRAPAGAAGGGAGSRPRGQLGAARPRREGPTRAARRRRRLQEVRAAAQGKAAEGPAECGHGRGDEDAAPAAPASRVPKPGGGGHSDGRKEPASRARSQPHVTPSRTLHPGPPRGTLGFVVCEELPPQGMPGEAVLADY